MGRRWEGTPNGSRARRNGEPGPFLISGHFLTRGWPVDLITMAIDFHAELQALRSTFGQIEAVLDPTGLEARISELEVHASAPGLWVMTHAVHS